VTRVMLRWVFLSVLAFSMRPLSCAGPGNPTCLVVAPSNGYTSPGSGSRVAYGASVSVGCYPGFWLGSSSTMYCSAGTLAPTPVCYQCTPQSAFSDCASISSCASAADTSCQQCTQGHYLSGRNCIACTNISHCNSSQLACSSSAASTCNLCVSGFYLANRTFCAACKPVAQCNGSLTCSNGTSSVCSACSSGYSLMSGGTACSVDSVVFEVATDNAQLFEVSSNGSCIAAFVSARSGTLGQQMLSEFISVGGYLFASVLFTPGGLPLQQRLSHVLSRLNQNGASLDNLMQRFISLRALPCLCAVR